MLREQFLIAHLPSKANFVSNFTVVASYKKCVEVSLYVHFVKARLHGLLLRRCFQRMQNADLSLLVQTYSNFTNFYSLSSQRKCLGFENDFAMSSMT